MPQTQKAAERPVRIKAVGDIALPSLVNDPTHAADKTPRSFDRIRSYLQEHDLLIGNLEGAITNAKLPRPDLKSRGGFSFRFAPGVAPQALAQAGFDALHIANNHLRDFRQAGESDTKRELSAAGIVPVGQKNEIEHVMIRDARVALLGFYDHSDFNNLKSPDEVRRLVSEAKRDSDLVVVTFHGGAEGEKALHIKNEDERFGSLNRGNIVQFARLCVDSGADVVIGSGPHVLRAVELYKGKLIAYSLANFVATGGLSSTGVRGLSAVLDISLSALGELKQACILPVKVSRESGGFPQPDPTGGSIELIRELTEAFYRREGKEPNLTIDDQGFIRPRPEPY